MSGGSYDYLCRREPYHLFDSGVQGQMRRMADRLAGLGYAKDAARETEELLLIVRQCEMRIETRLNRLTDVWEAVEWWDSCDWSEDEVKRTLEEYRNRA